jgi:hypothetical protein
MAISPTRYLVTFAVTTLFLVSAVALLNWRVDPLQYYRRAAFQPEFSTSARYQNPGLARNYDYDTVILGTSVSLGYDLGDLAARTGWRPLNLAMSGALPHEQWLLLQLALRTGRVKRVLWDLNYEYFGGNPDATSDYDGAFPAYLYDTNPITKLPNYLLNIDVTKASLRILLGLIRHKPPPLTLEDLTALRHKVAGAAVVRKSWDNAHHITWPVAQHPEEFAPEKTETNFDRNMLSVIQAHPEVTWDLWFPPLSPAYQAIMRLQMPAAWEDMFAWKRYIQVETGSLPQVRLHDFQAYQPIVSNPEHYTDMVHTDRVAHALLIRELCNQGEIATPAELAQSEAYLRLEARPEAVEAWLKEPPDSQAGTR